METAVPDPRLVRLLNDLETLRRVLRLYPQGHPALAPAQQRLTAAAQLFAAGERVAFGLGPGRVVVDGAERPLPPSSPPARLVELLFRAGVAALVLDFPQAEAALFPLAAALAAMRDPPGEEDRERLMRAAEEAEGFQLRFLDLSLVSRDAAGVEDQPGERLLEELVRRLLQDGLCPLPGGAADEATVATLAAGIAAAGEPETLLDHLFLRLGELIREEAATAPLSREQARVLLGELLRLLDEERRHLAVVAAVQHLGEDVLGVGGDAISAAAFLLDAVEYLLHRGQWVPPPVVHAVQALGKLLGDPDAPLPDGLLTRAQVLASRLEVEGARRLAAPPEPPLPAGWETASWAQGLRHSLEERAVQLDLGKLLAEAITLWPREEVAEAAANRLAVEFVNALEIGDLETAQRFASVLAAVPFTEARETAISLGLRAAVAALRRDAKEQAGTVVAILSSLGLEAVPHLLRELAEETHLTVRKRLLEVVVNHGPAAAPYVRPLLQDPRWYVVRNGVFLLWKLGDRGSLPELHRLLPRAAPQVRSEVLKALVALEDPHWLALLLREVDCQAEERVRTALKVAAHIPSPELAAALAARLRKRTGMRLRDPLTVELIRTLGQVGDPAALPALLEVTGLRQFFYPFSLTALRREAALAIARLPGEQARRAALALAQDRDQEVAAAVRRALRASSGSTTRAVP